MSDTFKNEKHQLTRADAAKMIEAAPARSEFSVALTVTAPLAQGGTQLFHPYVDITRTEAARLALRMFSDAAEQAGARVLLRVTQDEDYPPSTGSAAERSFPLNPPE